MLKHGKLHLNAMKLFHKFIDGDRISVYSQCKPQEFDLQHRKGLVLYLFP